MIVVNRQPFSVADYHTIAAPAVARRRTSEGPVAQVQMRFSTEAGEVEHSGQAFVDPGADRSILSLRWLRAIGLAAVCDHNLSILNLLSVAIGDAAFPTSDEFRPVVRKQGQRPDSMTAAEGDLWRQARVMPGKEDLLLGRDFLNANRLLLLVDGVEEEFSLVWAMDKENRRLRRSILAKLDASEEDPDE